MIKFISTKDTNLTIILIKLFKKYKIKDPKKEILIDRCHLLLFIIQMR